MDSSLSNKVDFNRLSPYVRYIHEYSGSEGLRVPNRYIYDHELVFFTHGGGAYTIEETQYAINAGDLHVIRPHQLNSCVVPTGYSRYFAVHFDFMYMGETLNFPPEVYTDCDYTQDFLPLEDSLSARPVVEPGEVDYPALIRTGDPLQYERHFVDLLQAFAGKPLGYQLETRSILLKILRLMYLDVTSTSGIVRTHPHREKIEAVIHQLKAHYHEKVDFARIAEDLKLSPNYLRTIFKEATGKSPLEYLIMYRMEKAKDLLVEGKYPIHRISQMIGYEDAHYFSRLFKQIENLAPKQYADSLYRGK